MSYEDGHPKSAEPPSRRATMWRHPMFATTLLLAWIALLGLLIAPMIEGTGPEVWFWLRETTSDPVVQLVGALSAGAGIVLIYLRNRLLPLHRIVQAIEPWGIVLAVVGFAITIWQFQTERTDREFEREALAWEMLLQEGSGEGARTSAMKYLVDQRVEFRDIDLSCEKHGKWSSEDNVCTRGISLSGLQSRHSVRFKDTRLNGLWILCSSWGNDVRCPKFPGLRISHSVANDMRLEGGEIGYLQVFDSSVRGLYYEFLAGRFDQINPYRPDLTITKDRGVTIIRSDATGSVIRAGINVDASTDRAILEIERTDISSFRLSIILREILLNDSHIRNRITDADPNIGDPGHQFSTIDPDRNVFFQAAIEDMQLRKFIDERWNHRVRASLAGSYFHRDRPPKLDIDYDGKRGSSSLLIREAFEDICQTRETPPLTADADEAPEDWCWLPEDYLVKFR